jgi:hypothetical protein
MAASRRQRIIEALATRLELIQTDNGFNTDAGSMVFLGEDPTFGPDDPGVALTISVGDATEARHQLLMEMPLEIVALVSADISAPLLAIEQVIADIRTAVETDDRTLDGECKQITRGAIRALPRESGFTVVGASVEYIALYSEVWGETLPDPPAPPVEPEPEEPEEE